MDIHPEVLDIKLAWLDSAQKGKWYQSSDLEPPSINSRLKKELYSPDHRSKIKSSELCQTVHFNNNKQASAVAAFIDKVFHRKIKEVSYDANSLFLAVLTSVSHSPHNKSDFLRRQCVYYLATYPELFFKWVKPYLNNSYENYIRNLFCSYAMPDYISLMAIAIMWNVIITIVNPKKEEIYMFHNSKTPDILIVHNKKWGLESHYTGTV